jgi:hypothetical protein
MLLNEFLNELRREPRLNPTKNVTDQLKEIYSSHGDDVYVSFSNIPKVGINPKSLTYTDPSITQEPTPVGIYAYPIKYVLDNVQENDDFDSLPYAGDRRYLLILKPKSKVIELSSLTHYDLDYFLDILRKKIGEQETEQAIWSATLGSRKNLPAGKQFWLLTQFLALELSGGKMSIPPEKSKNIERERTLAHRSGVVWNWLLKKIGIGAILDTNGYIFTSEPVQIVFIDVTDVEVVDTIENLTSVRKDKARSERKIERETWETIKARWPKEPVDGKADLITQNFLTMLSPNAKKFLMNQVPSPSDRATIYIQVPSFLGPDFLDFDPKVVAKLLINSGDYNGDFTFKYRNNPEVVISASKIIAAQPMTPELKARIARLVQRSAMKKIPNAVKILNAALAR